MSDPSPDEVTAKGFGVEINARGALVVLVVLHLSLALGLGYLMWKIGERIDLALRSEHAHIVETQHELATVFREEARQRSEEHHEMIATLKNLVCAAWYSPEERKAIRKAVEANPALKGAWCP